MKANWNHMCANVRKKIPTTILKFNSAWTRKFNASANIYSKIIENDTNKMYEREMQAQQNFNLYPILKLISG